MDQSAKIDPELVGGLVGLGEDLLPIIYDRSSTSSGFGRVGGRVVTYFMIDPVLLGGLVGLGEELLPII